MREIGSEFHFEKTNIGEGILTPSDVVDSCFVFSGRTAIETVLKNEPDIHKVLLPSYCCDSMIEPFRQAGINVSFYPVSYENGLKVNLIIPEDVDCILWCNYFGFNVKMPDVDSFKNRGGIIIEDITHSFFSKKQYDVRSDYLVASIRKWEPVFCGGFCATVNNELIYRPIDLPPSRFISEKRHAMNLKKAYLSGEAPYVKCEYLRLFSDSNTWLSQNYSGLLIDSESFDFLKRIDVDIERNIRINNASVLYKGLSCNKDIDFLFEEKEMDCPLYVPIIIKNGKRDIIRRRLIENSIYCPVHWPHPNEGCWSNMYDYELSLICDQRYNEKDMKRIVDVLCNERK